MRDLLAYIRENPGCYPDILFQRLRGGKYFVEDCELVQAVRALRREGSSESLVQEMLCALIERCEPVFLIHTRGLDHRPDLREEALAVMHEHLLREALDPREEFLTQNFIHALRCLCYDDFKRVLREDRRARGFGPAGRANRVRESRDVEFDSRSGEFDLLDPHDPYEHVHSREEVMRLLGYLGSPMDRAIVVLRAVEQKSWSDIAGLCQRTERSVSARYKRARLFLLQCIRAEQAGDAH